MRTRDLIRIRSMGNTCPSDLFHGKRGSRFYADRLGSVRIWTSGGRCVNRSVKRAGQFGVCASRTRERFRDQLSGWLYFAPVVRSNGRSPVQRSDDPAYPRCRPRGQVHSDHRIVRLRRPDTSAGTIAPPGKSVVAQIGLICTQPSGEITNGAADQIGGSGSSRVTRLAARRAGAVLLPVVAIGIPDRYPLNVSGTPAIVRGLPS